MFCVFQQCNCEFYVDHPKECSMDIIKKKLKVANACISFDHVFPLLHIMPVTHLFTPRLLVVRIMTQGPMRVDTRPQVTSRLEHFRPMERR